MLDANRVDYLLGNNQRLAGFHIGASSMKWTQLIKCPQAVPQRGPKAIMELDATKQWLLLYSILLPLNPVCSNQHVE